MRFGPFCVGFILLILADQGFAQTSCGSSGGITCTYVTATRTDHETQITSPSFTAALGDTIVVIPTAGNGNPAITAAGCEVDLSTDTFVDLPGSRIYQGSLYGWGLTWIEYVPHTVGFTSTVTCRWSFTGGGFADILVADFHGTGRLVTDQQNATNGSTANPTIAITNVSSPDLVVANLLTNAGTQPTFSNMTQAIYGNVSSIFAWTLTSGTGSFTATTTGGTSAPYSYSIASIGPPTTASLVRHRSHIF